MLTPTREIRIEPSTVCNYRCLMCARDKLTRKKEIMPTSFFEQIATAAKETLPHLEMCTVSGFGEFAMDPDWPAKLEIARRLYDAVHVVTNLSVVKDDQLSQLADLATEVRVSVNALGDERYQAVHRCGPQVSFPQVEDRIRRLSERRGPDFKLRLSLAVVKENEDQVEDWTAHFEGLVDGLEVWRPHNWVTGQRFRQLAAKRLTTCDRPATGPLQVQVDGTMNVCCFDFNGEMLIGDLRTQSLTEILTGPALARIRALHSSGRADELPLCAVCDQRDPPEHKEQYMVHCSFARKSERVVRTSSGYERVSTGNLDRDE